MRVEQEAENGLSAVIRFEYDLLGRITRMVDPAGQETLYSTTAGGGLLRSRACSERAHSTQASPTPKAALSPGSEGRTASPP